MQCVVAWLALRRYRALRPLAAAGQPPMTVLKPLHGSEPLLEEALASLCGQSYPDFQIVFGLQDPADPARAILGRLRDRFPGVRIDVVIDPTPHGSNRKIANLLNMLPSARHEMLVIADSDVHAPPDYLDSLAASLAQPGVGLVTMLWAGRPAAGAIVGRLGAAYINHNFLPGALLARALGRQDCLGATMALTRTVLDRAGGLQVLANELADDAVLGRRVRAQGLAVALARTVPATTVPEARLAELVAHELRWARTVRSLEPVPFALSVLQYPLFWAAFALVLSPGSAWAWGLLASAWLLRGALAHDIDRLLRVAFPLPIWCLPLRDLLSVAIMLASYRSERVIWRGQAHRATRPRLRDAGLTPGEELRPS